jgi:plastocyanin
MNAASRLCRCLRTRSVRAALLAVWAAGAACTASVALAASQAHEVVIEDMKFNPATLEVSQGDTVVWTNRDLVPHNATAEGGAFRSGDLQSGQSWTYHADKKGDFPYLCSLHPTMRARLVVK